MRFDEWQKWLDAQFVDEGSGFDSAAERERSTAVAVAEPPPPSYIEPGPILEETPAAPIDSQALEAPAGIPSESSVMTLPARPPAVAEPVHFTDEADVPSIEDYLPFLRPAPADDEEEVTGVREQGTGDRGQGTGDRGQWTGNREEEQPELELQPESEAGGQGTGDREQGEPSQSEPLLVVAADTHAKPFTGRYEISARRGRRARNVRPTRGPELSTAALWSLAPRGLQMLLAMQADNVPQHSYSRAFKESRIELIQRLLDPTLSLEDAARLLNVCPTTVRRYTNRGLLTHQRTPGDQRRFKLSDVLAFLEAQSRS